MVRHLAEVIVKQGLRRMQLRLRLRASFASGLVDEALRRASMVAARFFFNENFVTGREGARFASPSRWRLSPHGNAWNGSPHMGAGIGRKSDGDDFAAGDFVLQGRGQLIDVGGRDVD